MPSETRAPKEVKSETKNVPPAQSFRETQVAGNPSGAAQVQQQASGRGENTTASELGHTLPSDYRLTTANMQHESKGEDHLEPNYQHDHNRDPDDQPLSTAGPHGDVRRRELQSHEFDPPEHAPHQPLQDTVGKFGNAKQGAF